MSMNVSACNKRQFLALPLESPGFDASESGQVQEDNLICPPQAKKLRYTHEVHGDQRPDDYHWFEKARKLTVHYDLRSSSILPYLEEWNDYTNKYLAKLAPLKERI